MKKNIIKSLNKLNLLNYDGIKVFNLLRKNPHFTAAHCSSHTGVSLDKVKYLRTRLDRNGWLAGWAMLNEEAAKRTLT